MGGVGRDDLDALLNYAATCLSNVGNQYGSRDQKFTPNVEPSVLEKLVVGTGSEFLRDLWDRVKEHMFAVPPFALGYPSEKTQSAYYPEGENGVLTKEEISLVSRALEDNGILQENTRIKKTAGGHYKVLRASVARATPEACSVINLGSEKEFHMTLGDHSGPLQHVCTSLTQAARYAASDTQRLFLDQYVQSFQTGDLKIYRESQRTGIRDKAPRIENIFGFVEPYRDPHGIRAES